MWCRSPPPKRGKTAVVKAWRDFAAKYPGTEEGDIAEFFLATNAADDWQFTRSRQAFPGGHRFRQRALCVAAKLALAQVYAAQGKMNDGAQLIQSVIDHPTVMISKDAATIALADLIKCSDPQRARKLVDPLRTSTRSAVSKAAITLDSSLSQQ